MAEPAAKTDAPEKPRRNKGGAPTKYAPSMCATVRFALLKGATEAEVFELLRISAVTGWRWKQEHKEFCKAFEISDAERNAIMERSHFLRGTGYTVQTEKLFQHEGKILRAKTKEHIPGDVRAQISWLTNRDPKRWQDTRKFGIESNTMEVFARALGERRRALEAQRAQGALAPPKGDA